MRWITTYSRPLLIAILAFSFLTRVYNIQQPEGYVFDEVYHAVTAKLIAKNDPRAFEWWNSPVEPNTAVDWLHPPLAKYTQAVGILFFGENSLGWRMSSAVFGTLVVLMVYLLAEELFDKPVVGLVSALLASLDGLLLVQSRIAMNDIHVTFFIVLTLYCYVRYKNSIEIKHQQWQSSKPWLVASGVALGCAVASKWSGIFALAPLVIFEFCQWVKAVSLKERVAWSSLIRHILLVAVCWIGIPIGIYLASYGQMFLQGKDFEHLKHLHEQIWWYQTNLTATHAYQSRPWQWFMNARPVWYYVNYETDMRADIYAFGNPALFWLGNISVIFTLMVVVLSLYDWIRQLMEGAKKLKVFSSLFQLSLLVCTYFAVWLPWQASPRIMFFYHYTPAVPFLAIMLGYWLTKLAQAKEIKPWGSIITALLLVIIAVTFIIWYPHWTAIPMPLSIVDTAYFAVPSWK